MYIINVYKNVLYKILYLEGLIILKLYLFCPQNLQPVKKKQYWK
jgi:hypothetical protein